ncbi:hypothetical protein GCM10011344_06250 [Dokdonia pacifica]|uniref:Uncharacterized conserved protein YdeI, YjbR/CyaY-like superfamily, DUF1801 family n=1 Tax=Dokdonia pacifica TaxID=1627892 RepID=A0A238ZSS6_9FLAO|nr:YdeI/OmpD-associated family protein [Dokdonia pacifica]GGG08447.1 hypothetical protein GCM10011344_06250 [Dokdonia pacifica]SNR86496.1 Uncharacterized conserved protein YdeI, YjbR/CyaY-like superfamily, DUF1801 family [Dokdonia pacifica]
MTTEEKLTHYYTKSSPWKDGIQQVRTVIKDTELKEEWKWNFPCYTINGRNVVGVGNFKNHFGVWFFQGVFLSDTKKLLRNAQDGKTKAMRSLHYESIEDIDPTILKEYLLEAIQNAKDGKEVKADRSKKEVIIPVELESAFAKAETLQTAFKALTPSKQREYTEHIGGAKQEATRIRRLEKCIPMILEGIGLNDKYKNC